MLVGTLFAGIGNKYIVDSIMPESIHFSLADKVHALTFLFIMFSIGVTILVYQFYVKEKNTIARKIDYISFVVFTSFYIIMNIIWLNEAIYG